VYRKLKGDGDINLQTQLTMVLNYNEHTLATCGMK